MFIGTSFGFAQNQQTADLVIINAKIFTVSEENPYVQAIAVKDGKILALGSNQDIAAYTRTTTKVLDVEGKLVIPGFIDAHCHFGSGGHSLSMLDLGNALSVEYIQEQIAARVKELPEGVPVFGYASFPNPGLFKGLGWPTKQILDEVSPNNPVVMRRRGGHAVWVNSAALKNGPAYASFEEDIKGTLEVGKLADMVVLSKDLFTIQPRDITKTEVLYTILGGKIVYENPSSN